MEELDIYDVISKLRTKKIEWKNRASENRYHEYFGNTDDGYRVEVDKAFDNENNRFKGYITMSLTRSGMTLASFRRKEGEPDYDLLEEFWLTAREARSAAARKWLEEHEREQAAARERQKSAQDDFMNS